MNYVSVVVIVSGLYEGGHSKSPPREWFLPVDCVWAVSASGHSVSCLCETCVYE